MPRLYRRIILNAKIILDVKEMPVPVKKIHVHSRGSIGQGWSEGLGWAKAEERMDAV